MPSGARNMPATSLAVNRRAIGLRWHHCRLVTWFDPLAVLTNQILQPFHRFGLGDVKFYGGLANIEIHFAGRAADVTEIRIRHFARTIHNAAHDRDLYSLQMHGRGFDPRGRGLQIEQRAAARWTGD